MLRTLGFEVRRRLRWRRGAPRLVDESKVGLFDDLSPGRIELATAREVVLRERYGLLPLRDCSRRLDYRMALWLLDALEAVAPDPLPARGVGETLSAVDVGARNWSYVFVLERFLALRSRAPVRLTGVEIDGYGVYRDLRSRADWAAAFAAQTRNPQVRYVVDDFRRRNDHDLDVVMMLFPFVTLWPLRRWGLPDRLFDPRGLLHRAIAALRPGGHLVLLHQTDDEAQVAVRLLREGGARVERQVTLPSLLDVDPEHARGRRATLATA